MVATVKICKEKKQQERKEDRNEMEMEMKLANIHRRVTQTVEKSLLK